MSRPIRPALSLLAAIALGMGSLALQACADRDRSRADEAVEELKDEADDAKDELEDEIDDHT